MNRACSLVSVICVSVVCEEFNQESYCRTLSDCLVRRGSLITCYQSLILITVPWGKELVSWLLSHSTSLSERKPVKYSVFSGAVKQHLGGRKGKASNHNCMSLKPIEITEEHMCKPF